MRYTSGWYTLRVKKTVAFYTFGCRLNQAETARFRKWYLTNGWKEVDWRKADRVIVNTCAVTGKAEREVRGFLRRVRRENPKAEVWAMGCWVEATKSKKPANRKISPRQPSLKFFTHTLSPYSPVSTWRLFRGIRKKFLNAPGLREIFDLAGFSFDESSIRISQRLRLVSNEEKRRMLREMGSEVVGVVKAGYEKAFVKIQEGCDNFCTFCLVPYLRGRSRSEPLEEVVSQVKRLVSSSVSHQLRKNGRSPASAGAALALTAGESPKATPARRLFREVFLSLDEKLKSSDNNDAIRWVVLTGVDIAQYQDEGRDLFDLLEAVLEKTGVEKLGLGSIYPTFGLNGGVERLARLFAKYGERLEKRLHISLQSGSESVLRRMGRKTTAAQFAEVVKELREKIPGMVITTDVIVGFPGETEAEFEESLAFVKKMKFDKLHVFRYSPREGTVATKMLGRKGWEHVPERVVKERARRMRGNSLTVNR